MLSLSGEGRAIPVLAIVPNPFLGLSVYFKIAFGHTDARENFARLNLMLRFPRVTDLATHQPNRTGAAGSHPTATFHHNVVLSSASQQARLVCLKFGVCSGLLEMDAVLDGVGTAVRLRRFFGRLKQFVPNGVGRHPQSQQIPSDFFLPFLWTAEVVIAEFNGVRMLGQVLRLKFAFENQSLRRSANPFGEPTYPQAQGNLRVSLSQIQ